MGILQKIKSMLGLGGAESRETRRSGDVDVTVEREPSTADEDAVKGTDTSDDGTTATTSADTETDESADYKDDWSDGTETTSEDETEANVDDEPGDETEADAGTDAAADAEDSGEDASTAGSDDPVTEIKGIGPAYSERLAGVGIDTVGELAAADPADVAAETDLGENRIADWVTRANEY